uniref:AA_permease domain-containing protein n=1 Tax=Steinernema glaseri TaxID=37863 RepID=A0A1I7YKP9_9BILA
MQRLIVFAPSKGTLATKSTRQQQHVLPRLMKTYATPRLKITVCPGVCSADYSSRLTVSSAAVLQIFIVFLAAVVTGETLYGPASTKNKNFLGKTINSKSGISFGKFMALV